MLVATVLSIFAFLLRMLLCDIKYETSDDFVASAILSGAYGDSPDPHLLFSNILLGYFLKTFYVLFPSVSWYFVFMEALGCIALIVILFLTLKNSGFLQGLLFSALILVYYLDEIIVSIQFTKIATISALAGGLFLLYGLFNSLTNRKYLYYLGGTALFLFGTALRFDCLFIVLPFLFLQFCKYAHISSNTIRQIIPKFLSCLILIILSFALSTVNEHIWNSQPEYRSYREFNAMRPNLTDSAKVENDELLSQYNSLGLDLIDYDMLSSWGFRDSDVYSRETLQKVADINKTNANANTHKPQTALNLIVSRPYFIYPCFIGLIAFVCIMLLSKNNPIWSLIVFFSTLCMIVAFAFYGRLVYRVEFCIFLCSATILATAPHKDQTEPIKNKVIQTIVITFTAISVLLHAWNYIPDTSYKRMTDEEYIQYQTESLYNSEDYLPNRVRINISKRRSLGEFIERIENDSEHYYLLDFLSTSQLMNDNYAPWIRIESNYFTKNYQYLSGCDMYFPGEINVLESNGIDPENPYRSLINDNIYLVDNYLYDLKLAYLRKYWYPDVEIELVDEINGYKIWKLYIPEGTQKT